jgi:beta-N-acetylhexosaminidase
MNESLTAAAASLLIIGFPGTTSDEALRSLLRRGAGGVILFRRNIEDPVQVAALIDKLQASRREAAPLLVSVDQEGGRVARLKAPVTEFPDLALLGSTGDEYLAERFGEVLARELVHLGFNLDYAPVMDVDSNPANPVIGPRSLSRDPHEVARMGVAILRAMQRNGLLACAKHFPGHGDTSSDSHLELPELPHDLERLRRLELVPFRAAIDAGVATLMTAHVLFRALDPSVPATLSPMVIDGLLRRELGYQGVVFSDDLEMKAVLDHFGIAESVCRGLAAGVDGFLICHEASRQEEALEALVHAAESSSTLRDRLLESAARLARLREGIGAFRPVHAESVLEHLGLPEHLAVAEEIRRRGVSRQA